MTKRRSSLSFFFGTFLIVASLVIGSIYLGARFSSVSPIGATYISWINKAFQLNLPLGSNPSQSGIHSVKYRFAIVSDSHEDSTYFPKIVQTIANRSDLQFVADLGDLTNAGEKDKLEQAKQVLDTIPVPVYVIPGDHDLNWYPQHDLTNFKQVFKESRTSFSVNHQTEHFVFLDNSNLNSGIDSGSWQWLKTDLQQHRGQNIYVFMSTPISNPYLSFKAMGSQNDQVKQQASELGRLLAEYRVKAIFAGDTHTFAQYRDKATNLPIITVGAAGSTKNPLPLYVVVEIYTDGGYNVSSIPYATAIPVSGED